MAPNSHKRDQKIGALIMTLAILLALTGIGFLFWAIWAPGYLVFRLFLTAMALFVLAGVSAEISSEY